MLHNDDNHVGDQLGSFQETSLLDILIGRRIRNRRTVLGITQKDLGRIVGVSPQQIQKYETASNRVSCSTLYAFSKQLNAPINYFFENNKETSELSVNEDQESFDLQSQINEQVNEKEILKLVSFYKSIKDKNLRKKIYDLIETMSINIKSSEA